VEPYDFEEPFAHGAITAYQVTGYWPDDGAPTMPASAGLMLLRFFAQLSLFGTPVAIVVSLLGALSR
jgi:hypothetical protein